MKCICRPTNFYTRIYPALLGLVLLFFVVDWTVDVAVYGEDRSFVELIVIAAVLTFGYVLTWLNTAGLADEVWDAGDSLIVRVGETSARIPLADIEGMTESRVFDCRRLTIRLLRPAPFGRVLAFVAPRGFLESLMPFKSQFVEELEERVARAQQHARRSAR